MQCERIMGGRFKGFRNASRVPRRCTMEAAVEFREDSGRVVHLCRPHAALAESNQRWERERAEKALREKLTAEFNKLSTELMAELLGK